jgi:hypothetical protein
VTESLFPTHHAPALQAAVRTLALADDAGRGAVYTRPEIVRTILDLVGYTADRPLHRYRLLEPSFGGGDFLLPALDRLLDAFTTHGGTPARAPELHSAVRGVEVQQSAVASTRAALFERLLRWGASRRDATRLLDTWLVAGDFLLSHQPDVMDFVVGNPPYVRQERIPSALLEEYRRRYKTIYDRADLYVPFYERGLSLLAPGGRLGFICANRWIKNKYGGPLREHASSGFHLRYFIDLEGAPAFHSDVIAYPAITVFERGSSGPTRIAIRPVVEEASLTRLVTALRTDGAASDDRIDEVAQAAAGSDPWLLDAPARLRLLRRLEAELPDLEGAGCKVGIGVATGADKIYLGRYDELPVEPARKLPLVMAADLIGTELRWQGFGVLNPFEPDGSLASLDDYPLFGAYLRAHHDRVAARHCAKKSPSGWYRTIDRIWPELTSTPKLLIPDIKGEPTVVYDRGAFYPHHNLYFVTSDRWELPALGTVLRSSLAVLFISSYCVRMNGGFLRFQAQYLRRIRVPRWEDLSEPQRDGLRTASASVDLDLIDAAVAAAYRLSAQEIREVRSAADEARVPRRVVA